MDVLAPTLLETPRLILRALAPGDGAALHALYRDNRARLAESFPKAVIQLTDPDHSERYVAAKVAEAATGRGYWYGLWLREGHQLAGQLQVKNLDHELARGELAYLLGAPHEGSGLMSEAARALVPVCFDELGLYKLILRAIVGNARSEALATRLGFTCEGTLRGEYLTLDGRRVDLRYFGRLRTDPAPPA